MTCWYGGDAFDHSPSEFNTFVAAVGLCYLKYLNPHHFQPYKHINKSLFFSPRHLAYTLDAVTLTFECIYAHEIR